MSIDKLTSDNNEWKYNNFLSSFNVPDAEEILSKDIISLARLCFESEKVFMSRLDDYCMALNGAKPSDLIKYKEGFEKVLDYLNRLSKKKI